MGMVNNSASIRKVELKNRSPVAEAWLCRPATFTS